MLKADDQFNVKHVHAVAALSSDCCTRCMFLCLAVCLMYITMPCPHVVFQVLREAAEIAQLYRDQCRFPALCRADVGPVITSRYGGQYCNVYTGLHSASSLNCQTNYWNTQIKLIWNELWKLSDLNTHGSQLLVIALEQREDQACLCMCPVCVSSMVTLWTCNNSSHMFLHSRGVVQKAGYVTYTVR